MSATKTRALLYAMFFFMLATLVVKIFINKAAPFILAAAIMSGCFYYNKLVDYYFLAQIEDIRHTTKNELLFYIMLCLLCAFLGMAALLGVCCDNADCMVSLFLISLQLIFSIITYFNIGFIMAESCARTDFSNKKQIRRDRRLFLEIRRCKRKYVGVPYNTQNFTGRRDWPSMLSVVMLSVSSVFVSVTLFVDIYAIINNIAFFTIAEMSNFFGCALLVLFFVSLATLTANVFAVTSGIKACVIVSFVILSACVDLFFIAPGKPFFVTSCIMLNKFFWLAPSSFVVLSLLLFVVIIFIYGYIMWYFYKNWDNRKTKLNWNTHKDRVMMESAGIVKTQTKKLSGSTKPVRRKQKKTRICSFDKFKKRIAK